MTNSELNNAASIDADGDASYKSTPFGRPTFRQVHITAFIRGFRFAQKSMFTESDMEDAILEALSMRISHNDIKDYIENVKYLKLKN